MDYKTFIAKHSHNEVSLGIDNSNALRLIEYLPKRYVYAHYFWTWVWFLSIPTAIVIMIVYKWWAGLLLLFFTPMLSKSVKKSAADFVLEHAMENEHFYDQINEAGLLFFRPTTEKV